MSTVTTTKPINLSQLTTEVGSSLSCTDDGTTRVVTADTTQAALQTAVDAHVAINETGNRTTLEQQAATATQGNRDFLAIASPTNAQTLAQVKALTRQSSALIRLALGQFDATTRPPTRPTKGAPMPTPSDDTRHAEAVPASLARMEHEVE